MSKNWGASARIKPFFFGGAKLMLKTYTSKNVKMLTPYGTIYDFCLWTWIV